MLPPLEQEANTDTGTTARRARRILECTAET
jgi:hypothetical protein